MPDARPTVTVVIVNRDGRHHLEPCLESLRALDYPRDLLQVIVVDNGSSDGSVEFVRAQPRVALVQLDDNEGFAAGANRGAAAASSECVAFLNNDMRVEPGWLSSLAEARARHGVACVGGLILSWDGARIDFAGGALNVHGFGDQPGHGDPAPASQEASRVGEPFACGGSMLVDRSTFLAQGGFDERYFAYFEDVDFGWRLNLAGEQVAFAPGSRCFHHHHGTSGRFARYQRTLLLERNALRSVIKNVADEAFAGVLAGAVMLGVRRALDDSLSDRSRYVPFQPPRGSERIPANALARLHAIDDVARELPLLLAQRAEVQARRMVPDDVVFSRFGATFEPIGATSQEYLEVFRAVAPLLGGGDDATVAPSASPRGAGPLRRTLARHRDGRIGVTVRRIRRRGD